MQFIISALAVLAAAILYFLKVYSKFSDAGVKSRTPIPLIGNMREVILMKKSITHVLEECYQLFPEERFFGHYEFTSPSMIVKDLDLIKQITLKDFDYFTDHRAFVNKDNDPLFGNILFSMTGSDWRNMRSTLSPTFTSSKIKQMVPFMLEIGKRMLDVLKKKINESGVGYIEEDVKYITSRYTNDVIASCAFGLNIDSHAEENNQFYLNAKEAATFGFLQVIKTFLYKSFPKIMKKANISLFSETTRNFFTKLVADVMKEREEKNIFRPDMIQLLMEAKKGSLIHDEAVKNEDAGFAAVEESDVSYISMKKHSREWSEVELTAQAVVFLVAGLETVSTNITFLLLELALNPDIQDKLVQEIRATDQKNGGKFDFKSIQEMPYLDMVVSETLRLWPPVTSLDRICTKDYNMGRPKPAAKEDYIIRKGEGLLVPVYAIHHDPQYFPNPDKFDPERFSEQNRNSIKPFSYLPFGTGPRNCIGSRFALCEVKVMVYQLLRELEMTPSSRLQTPIELETSESINKNVKGGHWLKISTRK